MTQFYTMSHFGGVGVIPMFKSIITVIPLFFAIVIFFVWILGTASSYFAIFKTTGKKRFWHSLTSMSFVSFLLSLIIVSMNEANFTYLTGYWVAFYILMTLMSWFILDRYK